nr:hypothetical protein [Tanacetum cinerariifolium]
MTSFGYHLNPRFAFKECSSCGALYTEDFCCSKGNVEDKIVVPKPLKNCARCAKCENPNISESSDDSTNVVNAPREPVVVKQDHGVNPPHIDKCCCECGNALDGIFCQQCICKSCGKGAHTGYNCLPKILACCDDDNDYDSAITPILSIEETENSLSMGDEHLDTISTTESDEVIKSSFEDLVPILSESKGIPDTIDDDCLYKENIEYVEASPHDSELVNLEAAEIVILEEEEIKDDNLREKLLNNMILFIFDLTHEEFADELAHIISPPEYDCFYFWNLPNPGELMFILNSGIHGNLSTTRVNLPIEDDHSPLLAYVVWIFLAYLRYHVIPPYIHPFGNEDTIFDPGITINRVYSFKIGLSHRLLHLADSQPMLKSSYKAKASVIISIPPLVRGVADVVVEIKGTDDLL